MLFTYNASVWSCAVSWSSSKSLLVVSQSASCLLVILLVVRMYCLSLVSAVSWPSRKCPHVISQSGLSRSKCVITSNFTVSPQVLAQTQDHRHRVLVAAAKNVKVWFIKVRKIKAIYHTLNMFNLDVTHKCLIAECWCPVADLDRIQQALRRGTVSCFISIGNIWICVISLV